MKIAKFPVILLSLFVGAGIIVENIWHFSLENSLIAFAISIIILYVFHRVTNKKLAYFYPYNIAFAISGLLVGIITAYFGDAKNNQRHYTHFIQADKAQYFQLRVDKQLKSSRYYHSYIANVTQTNEHRTQGKILVRHEVTDSLLPVNTMIAVYCQGKEIKQISPPKNPYSFDYAQYMARKQIYRQINLKNKAFSTQTSNHFSMNALATKWRNHIYQILVRANLKGEKLALASALFLGERRYLSKETLQNFQASGTIHILAISGLHIGILLLFLNFVFGFVKRYAGVTVFTIITISLLWLYAMMTGFSPSVTRAVTMFSFLQIGLQLKRKTNIYNTIFASALLMMLANPNIIYEVGFQMSYAAVLSIVSFFPILRKRFFVKNKIANWFVKLFIVSLSAQLGVLPLSLYYFHQFPVYFFIANMLIIPLLFIILFYGFSYIILALTGIVIPESNLIFDFLLSLILQINRWIASLESALITQIRFSPAMLLVSFGLIILLYQILKKEKKAKYILILFSGIILLQSVILFEKYHKNKATAFYIFHQYKDAVVGKSIGENFIFYQQKDHINPYIQKNIAQNFAQVKYDSLVFLQKYHHKSILHIDSLGIYDFKNLKPEIIHLQNSPKINLDRVLKKLRPKLIIVDGSNYPSFIRRWQQSARKAGVKYYNTNKHGAFILK